MRKSLLFIILFAAMALTGCSDKKDQMPDFIPTPMPEADSGEEDAVGEDETTGEDIETGENSEEGTSGEEASEEGASEDTQITPTPKTVPVGQTKTMYVKLDKYDAVLNVRSAPSKQGEVVGFLVHTERVRVIDIVDGWASIAQSGQVHYVSADFLVEERPAYIEPPKPSPAPSKKPTPTQKPPQNTAPVEDDASAQDGAPDDNSEEAPPEI